MINKNITKNLVREIIDKSLFPEKGFDWFYYDDSIKFLLSTEKNPYIAKQDFTIRKIVNQNVVEDIHSIIFEKLIKIFFRKYCDSIGGTTNIQLPDTSKKDALIKLFNSQKIMFMKTNDLNIIVNTNDYLYLDTVENIFEGCRESIVVNN